VQCCQELLALPATLPCQHMQVFKGEGPGCNGFSQLCIANRDREFNLQASWNQLHWATESSSAKHDLQQPVISGHMCFTQHVHWTSI
jgi:hypothetical protein